jgi:hypothetical protein
MYLEINRLTILFSSVESDEDPVMQVMLRSIQDPELAPIYEGLPDLGWVLDDCNRLPCLAKYSAFFVRIYRSVRQYSYVSTVGMGVVTLKDIQSRVGSDDISCVPVFVT